MSGGMKKEKGKNCQPINMDIYESLKEKKNPQLKKANSWGMCIEISMGKE